jgi:regulatory protein
MGLNPDALACAIEFLKTRDRSRAEVEAKLAAKGFPNAEIEAVLDRLEYRKIIEDERIAQGIASSDAGIGPGRMRAKMAKLGLDESTVDSALVHFDDETQLTQMRQLITKRKFTVSDRAKAARFLNSRGFDEELVMLAIEREFGDE